MIRARYFRSILFFFVICVTAIAVPHAQAPANAPAETDVVIAPVVVDGLTLFSVRGVSSRSAETRADAIENAIVAVASDRSVPVDAIQAVEDGDITRIEAGAMPIMTLVDADARIEQVRRAELAAVHLAQIRQAVSDYRASRSPGALRRGVAYTVLATALLIGGIALLFAFWRWLDGRLRSRLEVQVRSVESKSFKVMRAEQIWDALRKALLAIRLLVLLAVLLLYTGFVLSQFPWTHGLSLNLAAFALGPVQVLVRSFIKSVPSLVFLIVLFVLVRVALRGIRVFFDLVSHGCARIQGFDPDWGEPTYKIVRMAIVAFALIVAYPYIPGSETDAFRGVSLFVGVLFSLGSSSAISNIIAGYMLTYRRALKVGDRVKIGDVMGDVIEMRLQVTHLRSFKNEEIIIPNSQILVGEVVNFSSLSHEHGLILHSEVGIGYETPWRQVEAMLLTAAARTEGALEEPRPFVWVKRLGDFAVTYEINVYTFEIKAMNRLYTSLHQHVLDVFNEHGVQIMTPAYEGDPDTPKVVPPEGWYAAPASGPR